MRKIKEVLRLKLDCKLSKEKIALSVGIGDTTVERYLFRFNKSGLSWPLPDNMSEEELENRLYPPKEPASEELHLPDFEYLHKELKRKGVTLARLWEEYTVAQPEGYSYSRFCTLYKQWKACDKTWMIQLHTAGECTYIDYAGLTVPIYDSSTGLVVFKAQIFVSALGASSYIFCEATRTQQTEDWLGSHRRMGDFYGGVTECWIPDNLKTGITQADRYEPEANLSYQDAAQHYGVSILPARVRKPQDKSKAEGSVCFVETQILAALRDHKFFSLEELNKEIKERLVVLNNKPFQKMPGSSRYSMYMEIEKSALKPLPTTAYELFHWGKEMVSPGYHIMIEHIPYSVPFSFVKKTLEFRYNERTVEFFYQGKTIAVHERSFVEGIPVTNRNHCPTKHQHQADCTPEKIKEQALTIGEAVFNWVEMVLEDSSLQVRQRINTTLGVVRLAKAYPFPRLNAACRRGIFFSNFKYRGIKDMLDRNLDQMPLPHVEVLQTLPQEHSNVRGSTYYE